MDGGYASPPPPEEGERSRRGDPNQICGLGEYDKERGIPWGRGLRKFSGKDGVRKWFLRLVNCGDRSEGERVC